MIVSTTISKNIKYYTSSISIVKINLAIFFILLLIFFFDLVSLRQFDTTTFFSQIQSSIGAHTKIVNLLTSERSEIDGTACFSHSLVVTNLQFGCLFIHFLVNFLRVLLRKSRIITSILEIQYHQTQLVSIADVHFKATCFQIGTIEKIIVDCANYYCRTRENK